MDPEDKNRVEAALSRISRDAWEQFLGSDEGRELAERLRVVRAALHAMGKLPPGAPPRPTQDLIELLGHRLLSDTTVGPWVRRQLLLTMAPGKWVRLAVRYRELAGARAEDLHGNATREGRGSEVMAGFWHQGGRWAEAFCDALDLPAVLHRRRVDPSVHNEVVEAPVALGALHDFQHAVYRQLVALLEDGRGATALLSLPTGAGKTRVAVEALCDHLARSVHERGARNVVLWIAQSQELLTQAWSCFRQVWQCPPERREGPTWVRRAPLALLRAWGGVEPEHVVLEEGPTVIVAGIAQLASWCQRHPEFFETLPRRRLAAVIVDEAHGLITNEFREVLVALGVRATHHWRPLINAPPVLGLTATPWRRQEAQNESLLAFFQRNLVTPAQLGARPIETLQERKVLARVRWERLRIDDETPMSTREKGRYEQFHELPPEYLERLGAVPARNARIVERLLKLPESSRALVFACSVEHAEVLTLLLNRANGSEVAAVVTGRTPRAERAEAIERFRSGSSLRFLCNVGVLTTGFDAPRADVVCITRPTTSAVLYEQMVGRGLRGPLNGGTSVCRVLDVQDEGMPEGIMSYGRVVADWDASEAFDD